MAKYRILLILASPRAHFLTKTSRGESSNTNRITMGNKEAELRMEHSEKQYISVTNIETKNSFGGSKSEL